MEFIDVQTFRSSFKTVWGIVLFVYLMLKEKINFDNVLLELIARKIG